MLIWSIRVYHSYYPCSLYRTTTPYHSDIACRPGPVALKEMFKIVDHTGTFLTQGHKAAVELKESRLKTVDKLYGTTKGNFNAPNPQAERQMYVWYGTVCNCYLVFRIKLCKNAIVRISLGLLSYYIILVLLLIKSL